MIETDLEKKIRAIIEPSIHSMGFDVVRIVVQFGKRYKVQIMAEPKDLSPMTVDHCADLSRTISALFDVSDPIQNAYILEVSSPGIDRPLTRKQDFSRFASHVAKLETITPIQGQKHFKGVIEAVSDDQLTLIVEGHPVEIPFALIKKAKLILTDDLLKQVQNQE